MEATTAGYRRLVIGAV